MTLEINRVVYFDISVFLIECSKSCELPISLLSLAQLWGETKSAYDWNNNIHWNACQNL
jgi:hypothetical protein